MAGAPLLSKQGSGSPSSQQPPIPSSPAQQLFPGEDGWRSSKLKDTMENWSEMVDIKDGRLMKAYVLNCGNLSTLDLFCTFLYFFHNNKN